MYEHCSTARVGLFLRFKRPVAALIEFAGFFNQTPPTIVTDVPLSAVVEL